MRLAQSLETSLVKTRSEFKLLQGHSKTDRQTLTTDQNVVESGKKKTKQKPAKKSFYKDLLNENTQVKLQLFVLQENSIKLSAT